MNQIITALALFFGEVLIIGAEIWSAKMFSITKSNSVLYIAFAISLIGVVLLVYGYTFGYQVFKNIWIVTAISIAGILVVEPVVAWFLFREIPTLGAGIALALGVVGIIVSLFVK